MKTRRYSFEWDGKTYGSCIGVGPGVTGPALRDIDSMLIHQAHESMKALGAPEDTELAISNGVYAEKGAV